MKKRTCENCGEEQLLRAIRYNKYTKYKNERDNIEEIINSNLLDSFKNYWERKPGSKKKTCEGHAWFYSDI